MKIALLNGNPDAARQDWEDYLDTFVRTNEGTGSTVCRYELRELKIHYCTGCWSCWYATPGLCAFRDDMVDIYKDLVTADLLVWASPLILGNVSALTKKAQDRFIPMIHPYIELDHGECHHRRRYPKNFDMGLIIGTGPEDTDEDVAIVKHQHERLARNGRGELRLFESAALSAKELVHEAIGA